MFISVKNLAIVEESDLVRLERLIAFELIVHSDAKGVVRMGQVEMANHTGISRITIGKILKNLEKSGFINKISFGKYRLDVLLFNVSHNMTDAHAEVERLKLIQKPNEEIFWTEDRWPVLRDIDEWDGSVKPE